MATHDIFSAVEIATTVGIMKEGTIVKELKTSEIDAKELNQIYLETI